MRVVSQRKQTGIDSDRNHGRSRGAAGALRREEKGRRGEGENEKAKADPGDALGSPLPCRRQGLSARSAEQPAPGMRLPVRVEEGGGKVCGEVTAREMQGFRKGTRVGDCAMLLLWQDLACNKSLEHFP